MSEIILSNFKHNGFLEEIKVNIPLFMIPMRWKNEYIYNKVVLSVIKEILSENNINSEDKQKI